MTKDEEKAALQEIIEEDHYALSAEKDKCEGFTTVSVEEGDEGRWVRWMTIVTQAPSGTYYKWEYARGLTENQEDEVDSTVTEVKPEDRTVVIREWVTV